MYLSFNGFYTNIFRSQKPISAHCRNCARLNIPALTPFQLVWAEDPGQKRWKYYPDLNASLTPDEIRTMMQE